MNDYPLNARHGDAWKWFAAHMRDLRIAVPGDESRTLWPHYLRGWLDKAKQRDQFTVKRR